MSKKLKSGRLSLRQRILFLTTLTTGIGLVLASAGYLAYDIRMAREQKLQQLDLAADLIATNAAASFVFDDPASAEKYLAALKARSGFRGGALYMSDGKVLATYDAPDGLHFVAPNRTADGAVWEPNLLKLTSPVMLEGQRLGTVYLEWDLRDLHARTRRIEALIAEVALGMLVLVCLVTSLLSRSITRPIEQLAALTRSIAIAKEYDARAPLLGAKELQYLAVDFNHMLAEIQKRERALVEARDTLELRVASRTVELEQEINEKRKAERSLRESEELFRTVSEAAPVGIYRSDLKGNATYMNQALLELFGLSGERAEGMAWRECIHPEDLERVAKLRTHAMLEGKGFATNYRVKRRDETIRWAESRAKPLRTDDGKVLGYVGVVQDVTERVKREEEIRRSEEKFRTLAAVAPVGIVLLDDNGKFTYINEQYLRMTGLTEGEALENRWPTVIHPDDLERIQRTRELSATEKADYAMSYRYLRRDNSVVWAESSARGFEQASGERGYVVVIQDVTERKLAEEGLRKAKEAAEAANRAKSNFLANMSHEIRTPMNGILGMTELALDTELQPEQREYLGMVRSSAEALLGIINDILDFSKIEAGKMELEETTFGLEDCIEQALGPLGVRATEKGLDLTWTTVGGIPGSLRGDSTRLRQVLINLAGNAIKFTKAGEVSVKAERLPAEEGKAKIRFVVSDTGIGVPPEKHKQIFEAFSQADMSTTREFGGTGLGLSISARLVRLMGGEIGLESEAGKGSEFHFTVVFDVAEEKPRMLREVVELKDRPVLVVDDNEVNRHLLRKLLSAWGMKPVMAADGIQGMEKFEESVKRNEPYPVVLLDMNMPRMDGYQVAVKIRQSATPQQTAIVILSSSLANYTKASLDPLQIGRKLSKPIRRAELHEAITDLLAKAIPSQVAVGSENAQLVRKLRLLLVEDNPVNQKLASRLLEKMGHEVKLAVNGREAVGLATREEFDLVLMDIQMPVMGGMEATKEIREHEEKTGRRTPIVAMTAHAMKGDRERCIEGGMDGYLSKPVRVDLLRSEIQRLTVGAKTGEQMSDKTPETADNKARHSLNLQELLARVENDWDLLRELGEIFREDFPKYEENLRDAIAKRDPPRAAEAAHALKGMLANLSAATAAAAANDVEQGAKNGHESELAGALKRFEKETAGLLAELDGYLAGVQK